MKTFKEFIHIIEESNTPTLETVFGSHSINEQFNFKPSRQEIDEVHEQNKVEDTDGSVKNYTYESAPINSALHQHHKTGEADGDMLDKAKKLTSVLSKHNLKSDTTLFTGLRRNPTHLFENNGSTDDPVTVTLPAFTSTSNHVSQACHFAKPGTHASEHTLRTPNVPAEDHSETHHMLMLHTPAGTEGGSVRDHAEFKNEHEILLNRGLQVEIHPHPTTFIHPKQFGNVSSGKHFTVWHARVIGNNRKDLNEASYLGNLGMMELVKFRKVASIKQKQDLADHIRNKKHKEVRDLIHKVTGVKLKPIVQESQFDPPPGSEKIKAWQQGDRPTNKIAIQGHQVHMDKDGMKIYHGGELVHHKKGDFSNPTNLHKSMATRVITDRIRKSKLSKS